MNKLQLVYVQVKTAPRYYATGFKYLSYTCNTCNACI